MHTNKHTALSLEKQHLRGIRKYYLSITDINTTLGQVHKSLYHQLDLPKYAAATDYIHQYISHTTVWNLKFVLNLESPEVALLQIFHLDYILAQEPADKFVEYRAIVAEQKKCFYALKPFTEEHREKRLHKMRDYISQHNQTL